MDVLFETRELIFEQREKKSIQNKTQNIKIKKKRVILENLMEKSPYKPIGKVY